MTDPWHVDFRDLRTLVSLFLYRVFFLKQWNIISCVIDRICGCLPMTSMSRDEKVDEVRLEQCGRELADQIRIDGRVHDSAPSCLGCTGSLIRQHP